MIPGFVPHLKIRSIVILIIIGIKLENSEYQAYRVPVRYPSAGGSVLQSCFWDSYIYIVLILDMQCTLVRRYALSNDQSKQQDHIKDLIAFESNNLILKFVSTTATAHDAVKYGVWSCANISFRKLLSNKNLIFLSTGAAYDRRPTRHEMMAAMAVMHMLDLPPAPAREDSEPWKRGEGPAVLTGRGRRQVQHVHHHHLRHHFVPRRSPVVGCTGWKAKYWLISFWVFMKMIYHFFDLDLMLVWPNLNNKIRFANF